MDLYPDPTWNFVFGQALPDQGVGIWSIARLCDHATASGFGQCLRRTIGTATHEIGHLLAIDHCVAWECQMNGRNSLEEADSGPLDVCPVCLQKLAWFGGFDPAERLRRLAELAREQGMASEATRLEQAASRVAAR